LQVESSPASRAVTITCAAERLGSKHNSSVELVDRSEREGLLTRAADPKSKLRAILKVARKGNRILDRLSEGHARKLNELAPLLNQTLMEIRPHKYAVVSSVDR
jgi:DNA-binding MarR family transcriptional regulator